MKWIGDEPLLLVTNNIYENNDARYGSNIASTATHLKILSQIDDRILKIFNNSIQNVASG